MRGKTFFKQPKYEQKQQNTFSDKLGQKLQKNFNESLGIQRCLKGLNIHLFNERARKLIDRVVHQWK